MTPDHAAALHVLAFLAPILLVLVIIFYEPKGDDR